MNTPPHHSGYRYLYDQTYPMYYSHMHPIVINKSFYGRPHYSQMYPPLINRPVVDVRPEISCTMHVIDNVCDKKETPEEQKACKQGAVSAHTQKENENYFVKTLEESNAYRDGFYSAFSCPLQASPFYF